MQHRPVQLIALLAAFILGLLVAKRPAFDFTQRLTAGDLLSAMTSVLLAIVLGVAVQKAFSDTRVEKDLLMGQAKEISVSMRAAREVFLAAYHDGPTDVADRRILAALRLVSVQLTTLERAAERCKLGHGSETLVQARTVYRLYRRLVSDRALAIDTKYPIETFSESESAFGTFTEALLMYSIEINRR